MAKKTTQKAETTPQIFLVEVVETKDKKQTRTTHYEGETEEEASKKMMELREQNTPHIEFTNPKRGLVYVYKKKPGEQNYRLSGQKL